MYEYGFSVDSERFRTTMMSDDDASRSVGGRAIHPCGACLLHAGIQGIRSTTPNEASPRTDEA